MGIVALPVIVMNNPPSSTNLCSAKIPSKPHARAHIIGRVRRACQIRRNCRPFNGIGSPVAVDRPFTIDCAVPPTGPNRITSYFDRNPSSFSISDPRCSHKECATGRTRCDTSLRSAYSSRYESARSEAPGYRASPSSASPTPRPLSIPDPSKPVKLRPQIRRRAIRFDHERPRVEFLPTRAVRSLQRRHLHVLQSIPERE